MRASALPRILIIDDTLGREVVDGINRERESGCGKLGLRSMTSFAREKPARFTVEDPVAEAWFCRAQRPVASTLGDIVDNCLEDALKDVEEGWTRAFERREPPWSLVLLDLCFYTGRVTEKSNASSPGMPEGRRGDDDPSRYFGLDLLEAIQARFPDLPVVILSSMLRGEVSERFTQQGALDFIARDDPEGGRKLQEMLALHGLVPDPGGRIIGHSLPLLLELREARRTARHRESVLIQGERGTGKELFASVIHRERIRVTGNTESPFVAVNTAGLSPSLFASELFGVAARSATGVDARQGLIEQAHGGSLFLDEIADMPPDLQSGLLRVLQDRQVTRVGGRTAREIDVRFLSATNVDLDDTRRGFRSDLFDRLRMGGTITLPPLRERREDIPILAEHFLREAEADRDDAMKRDISPDALAFLQAHSWPGNIRELRSAIRDAVNRHPGVEHLVPGHLRLVDSRAVGAPRNTPSASGERPSDREGKVFDAIPGSESALSQTLRALKDARFTADEVKNWMGRHDELQRASNWFIARQLEAALRLTRQVSVDTPDGKIQIHPAMRLATGDDSLTATKAADLIKRVLTPLEDELTGVLREALEIALRLRPRSERGRHRGNP